MANQGFIELSDIVDRRLPIYEMYHLLGNFRSRLDVTEEVEVSPYRARIVDAVAHSLQQPAYAQFYLWLR